VLTTARRPSATRSLVRRLPALAAAALALGLGPAVLAGSASAGAATTPSDVTGSATAPPSASSATAVGLTVSWLPVGTPVTVVPGKTAHGIFWITNETAAPVPVRILAATAVPGNNGTLVVRPGRDKRFPAITYTPDTLVAEPSTTTPVAVAVVTPRDLAPGVYLLPAAVRPLPVAHGNVQIQQEIDALVTLEVQGRTSANVTPVFVTTAATLGGPTTHLPGFPPVQIGTAGHETLRVLDDSPASFYAYNEVTGAQSPFGEVVFDGHTAGAPSDLRTPPDLYFPGHWRDYAVTWHASKLGLGLAHLQAYVSFHATPSTVVEKEVTAEVLVVSPWWVLLFVGYLLVLLAAAFRRARRLAAGAAAEPRRTGVGRRLWQLFASGVMVVVVLATSFVGQPAVFAVVAGAGVLLAVLAVAAGRPVRLARRLRDYVSVAGGLVLFGGVAVVLAGLSSWPGTVAVGLLAGVAVWTLLGWWLLWWTEEHPAAGRTEGPAAEGPEAPGSPEPEPPPGVSGPPVVPAPVG
jgi:hypothetical protein